MPDPERQANRLRALVESGLVFAEAVGDVDRLLGIVTRRFAELIGDGCYVRLLADDGIRLLPVATYHPDPEILRYLCETTDQVSLVVGEGISGKVVATGEPVFLPEVPFDDYRARTKPEFVPIFERIGVTSLIVVPLQARGIRFGFIALVRNGVGRPAYTTSDLELVVDLAARAALAIDNSRLVEGLERLVGERTRALEQTNKELEAFAHSISDDLHSPLRAIDGLMAELERDHASALDDDGRRALDVIRRNARRMSQLVDELLRLSRTGRDGLGAVESIDMRGLIDSTVDAARVARPGRAIEVRTAELPRAIGNPQLLRQVWINLIDNAIKYSGKREVVQIEIAGTTDDHHVHYSITDHGVGFDPAASGKLFGVFQRLHSASEFEGIGVGLALVQRIVTRHGGTVAAEGRPGKGATFSFTLPSRGPV